MRFDSTARDQAQMRTAGQLAALAAEAGANDPGAHRPGMPLGRIPSKLS